MNLFGRKKADAPPPKPKELSSEEISAKVAELTTMRETIEKKQAHIERQSTLIAQQAIARSKLGDKRGALLLVKKKKMHDVEAQKFNGMIGHLDKQIGVLSNAQLNSQFMATMVGSQAAIAQIQKGVNLETVEDVRDKFEEQMEDHKAVSDMLGEEWGPPVASDVDLAAELAELEEMDFAAHMASVPASAAPAVAAPPPAVAVAAAPAAAAPAAAAPAAAAAVPAPEAAPMVFPSVPTTVPVAAPYRSMEDELAALEAAM